MYLEIKFNCLNSIENKTSSNNHTSLGEKQDDFVIW